MGSPFPGMDPYLESRWGDVQTRLIIYASDQLNAILPRDLRARVEERVFVESPMARSRDIRPDIRIIEKGRKTSTTPVLDAGIAVAEPHIFEVPDDPTTQVFLQIVDVSTGGRVVTGLELLSVSNKLPGQGRELYLQKQLELLQGGVSSVVIDLLREERRDSLVPFNYVLILPRSTYQACVRRGEDSQHIEAYPISLRERLPAIRIPLRPSDPGEVPLDLQAIVDQCYRNAGYDYIDYQAEPDPPLDPADSAWADSLLREKGLR
jgi:hypothetical protein